MSNPEQGKVVVNIGGRSYVAKFDFHAIYCLETHFGSPSDPKPLKEVFVKGRAVPASMLPIVLWACLNADYEDEFPTVRSVSTKLEMRNMAEISAKVTELIQHAQAAGDKKGANAVRPTPAAEIETTTGPSFSEQPVRSESVSTTSGG